MKWIFCFLFFIFFHSSAKKNINRLSIWFERKWLPKNKMSLILFVFQHCSFVVVLCCWLSKKCFFFWKREKRKLLTFFSWWSFGSSEYRLLFLFDISIIPLVQLNWNSIRKYQWFCFLLLCSLVNRKQTHLVSSLLSLFYVAVVVFLKFPKFFSVLIWSPEKKQTNKIDWLDWKLFFGLILSFVLYVVV